MNKKKNLLLMAVVVSAVLALTGCNPIENDTRSASLLTVMRVTGTNAEGQEADYLESDVLTNAMTFADVAVATIRNTTLDPDPIAGTSQYEDVTLERYIVSYSQPNGANQEGVDVPFSFEGFLSITIPVNTETTFAFDVVRNVAKTDPPLVQLQDGVDVLQVTAKIEFFGHDLANRDVKTSGFLTIYFANYADQATAASTRLAVLK